MQICTMKYKNLGCFHNDMFVTMEKIAHFLKSNRVRLSNMDVLNNLSQFSSFLKKTFVWLTNVMCMSSLYIIFSICLDLQLLSLKKLFFLIKAFSKAFDLLGVCLAFLGLLCRWSGRI
jgi:hypothetical protein